MKFSVKSVPSEKNISPEVSTKGNASTGRVFLSGVLVLTLSTVLVKIIGLLYKIPMLRVLGSEGMGYFNAAYEWYGTLCVIATSGLPLASSMMIASARAVGDDVAVKKIERLSLRIFGVLGLVSSLLLFFGAPLIAQAIGSPDTRYAIAAVAPTMLFSCLAGAYRGYFQGYQDMKPTAISQVIEALGKLILGLIFAYVAWSRDMGAPHIAAWAMLGLSIGVALSTLYLMLQRNLGYSKATMMTTTSGTANVSLRRLLAIAVPITVSSSVMNVTRLFDMALILRRLQHIGYDTASANALYGSYTTMAIPMFNLIPSLITSVALALVPSLTAAIRADDAEARKTTTTTALRLTALLALPASMAVVLYSRTILTLLFRGETEAVDTAAPLLSILAVSIFFSGVITTTNAILQAYGRVRAPIVSMLVGSAAKLIFAYALIGIPKINIYGAPISTFVCDAVIVGVNLFWIAKKTDVPLSFREICYRPLLLSTVSVGLPGCIYAMLTHVGYSPIGLFFAAVPLTVALYLLLGLRLGVIGAQEIALLPRPVRNKFMRFCNRFSQP